MSYVVTGAVLDAQFQVVLPSLTVWSRLEVLPTTADLAPGLRTEIADPLWMVNRQHVFGELHGEDAGSPVDVRLVGEQARIARFHPGPLAAEPARRATDDGSLPLEIVVEREAVDDQRRLAAAAGQQALRLLADEGAGAMGPRFVAEHPLAIPEPVDALADRAGADWRTLLHGRGLDGMALIASLDRAADGTVADLPASPSVPQASRAATLRALNRFAAWWDGAVSTPTDASTEGPAAWVPERQEYALAVAARLADGPLTLRADEYTDGRLDWWAFDVAATPSLGDPATAVDPVPIRPAPMLPTAVRYPGMPADRLWEFEDATVNLGSLEAGPTDLGRLLLSEYALVFGNDWWVVPLDVPVGSVVRVGDLRVRDTFGKETVVPPSVNEDGSPWEMFTLARDPSAPARLDRLFFLPPVLPNRLEGDPIEEIHLLRDEMANLAWAVEARVAGVSGEPMERGLEATRAAVHQQLDGDAGDAELVYRLQTQVPINWIPFAPVAAAPLDDPDFRIVLERRALLRTRADGTTEAVHPRGVLLRTDLDRDVTAEPPLQLQDEEASRAGAIMTRSFQYARWLGGASHLWVGRAKRTGRGEGSSGLRYDTSDRRT